MNLHRVDPQEQLRIVRPVGPAGDLVHAPHSSVQSPDPGPRRRSGHRISEGRDHQVVAGPLEPAPGILPEVAVLGDRRHRERIEALDEQGPQAADEPRGVAVDAPRDAVRAEKAQVVGIQVAFVDHDPMLVGRAP